MAKIFLVISILVSALTGGLAYMTKSKVDGINTELAGTKTQFENEKRRADQQTAEVKKKDEELKAETAKLAVKDKEVADAVAAKGEAESKLTAAQGEAEKATVAAKDWENKYNKAIADKPVVAPVPGENPEVTQLTAQLAQAKDDLAKATAREDELKRRETDASQKLAEATRRIDNYQRPVRQQGVTGRVLAVNNGWNFVVVDLGDNKGATVNSPLLVMRGGSVVGKLRITSVEPSSSIADLIPGSVPRGASVQPGDRVVFSGRLPQSTPNEGGAGATGAPNTPPAGNNAQAETQAVPQ